MIALQKNSADILFELEELRQSLNERLIFDMKISDILSGEKIFWIERIECAFYEKKANGGSLWQSQNNSQD